MNVQTCGQGNSLREIVHFRGNSLLEEISKSMTVNSYSKNTVKSIIMYSMVLIFNC